MTDEEQVSQALAELWDIVKCRCHEAYTGRGLHDPDCECDSTDAVRTVANAIATLRAQLAEAQTERDAMIHPDHVDGLVKLAEPMLYEALAAETGRADRAEAALAAQIEVDAGMIERIITEARQEIGYTRKLSPVDATVVELLLGIAAAIRAQPRAGAAEHGSYDSTALDRVITQTREKALREALEIFGEADDAREYEIAILALIEKEKSE